MCHVSLTKTEEVKLGYPYSECKSQTELLEHTTELVSETILFNRNYKRDKCYYLCFFKYFAQFHSFTIEELFFNKSLGIINMTELDDEKLKQSRLMFNFDAKCAEKCPLECKAVTYNFFVNHRYNSFSKEESSRLVVTFKEMKYLKISQTPAMSVTDLVSAIGGTLGKFKYVLLSRNFGQFF